MVGEADDSGGEESEGGEAVRPPKLRRWARVVGEEEDMSEEEGGNMSE